MARTSRISGKAVFTILFALVAATATGVVLWTKQVPKPAQLTRGKPIPGVLD